MTYEELVTQQAGVLRQLNTIRDAQAYDRLNAAWRAAISAPVEETEEQTIRPQDATGLLATDYALDDYNTWK